MENDKSKDPFIEGCSDNSTGDIVHFLVSMSLDNILLAKQEGLLKKFKLTTSISTSNMHLFDSNGLIKKYDTPEQILEEFFHIRLDFYEKRKKALMTNLENDLLKCENKYRFIWGVVEGSIIVSNRKRADLFRELKEKGFTPFPKKKSSADVFIAGSTDDTEETEENSPGATSQGDSTSDYDYLLSMAIGTLTLEKLQELRAERDKLLQEVEDLKKATIKSLWLFDLDALEGKLDELEESDEQIEMERKKILGKAKITRPVLKNPRKNNKKASNKETAEVAEPNGVSINSVPETDNIAKNKKVKGKAAARKKAPARKAADSDDDDYDGMAGLRQRLASYNLNSSPDHAEDMETEVPKKNKEPSKRAAAQKNQQSTVSKTPNDEDEIEIIEDDYEHEEKKKKAGKKPANVKAAPKPPAGTKKRGPIIKQSQVLGQEVLKLSENSPDNKVRKMRASPFNKKSSSVLGREITMETSPEHENSLSSLTGSVADNDQAVAPRARPQRANRGKQTYVISDDSESDAADDSESDQYSDFNDDED